MINLDEEIVVISRGDQKVELKKPTNGQIKKYRANLEKAEDKEKALEELLKEIGMPEEMYDTLTPGQLKKVIAALYESEKN